MWRFGDTRCSPHSGRHSTVSTPEIIDHLQHLILVKTMTDILEISKENIGFIAGLCMSNYLCRSYQIIWCQNVWIPNRNSIKYNRYLQFDFASFSSIWQKRKYKFLLLMQHVYTTRSAGPNNSYCSNCIWVLDGQRNLKLKNHQEKSGPQFWAIKNIFWWLSSERTNR